MDIDVVLKAKGIGTTIFCKEDLNSIAFGVQYTHRLITREIFVENKGRKDQKLTWQRKKPSSNKANGGNSKDDEDGGGGAGSAATGGAQTQKKEGAKDAKSSKDAQEVPEEPDVF
jgi:hypothetical protein